MLYFDHAATTPPLPEVIDSVARTMAQYFGNPSSLHRLGKEAETLLRRAREVVASTLKAHPDEIIFTSGGTEGNNLAIKGAAWQYRSRGRHIITTQIEHPSVYECCRQLEREGYEVTYLPADASGRIDPEAVRAAIRKDTILVSVMHVNNETGAIQPVEEIGRMLRNEPRIIFHVDAVQSVGKLELEPARAGIDLMTASAHKIHGPRGVGFLYCREPIRLTPLLSGGGQEGGVRSGTEALPLITGMTKAFRLAAESLSENRAAMYRLRARLVQGIGDIPGLRLTGAREAERMAPHIVHFTMPGVKSEIFVHALEEYDIYVSTRSACSSGSDEPSRVLLAMGMPPEEAASGIRISLSPQHTEEDIDVLLDRLRTVAERMRALQKQGGKK